MPRSIPTIIIGVLLQILAIQAKNFYTVIGPRVLHPNSDYHVALTSYNHDNSNQFFVSIEGQEDDGDAVKLEETIVVEPYSTRIVNFEVGDIATGEYNLTVRSTDFHQTNYLQYVPKSYSVFIQTDKAIYKPGHVLRFRCIVLDKKLRPGVTGTIDVRISDGEGNRVKQWPRALTSKGVFSGELPLSKAPVLGEWTIEVVILNQSFRKTIEVAEYVLPKFSVNIDAPKFVTFSGSKIPIKVQTKYAFDRKVKGELTVTAYPLIYSGVIQPIFQSPARHVVPIDGETTVEIDIVKELNLDDEYARPVTIEAVVEEEHTGRRQNTSAQLIVYKYQHRMQLFKSAEFYKPGLNFTAQLMVVYLDGTPVTKGRVTVRHGFTYNERNHETSYHELNAKGTIDLNFATPPNNSAVLEVEAEFEDMKEVFPAIAAAISPSKSYLQLSMNNVNPRVNDELSFMAEANEGFTYLTWQVFARGDLLISNTHRSIGRSATVNFKALPQMAPTAHLIAQFVNGRGELVADAISFDVGGSLQNYVNITTNIPTVTPGKDVEITVQTRPRSFVGVLAIDKNVLQLKSGNDVTLKDVENELRSYDSTSQTPYRDEDAIVTPGTWRPGSDAAAEAFKDSGAIILTNTDVPENLPKRGRARQLWDSSKSAVTVKPNIGPAFTLPTATRPPLAGPYAFSRIPKPRLLWNHPKVFLNDLIPLQDTWLLLETSTGNEGRTSFHRAAPDSITTWSLTGFSLDPVWGLGLTTQPTEIRAFQKFFIRLDLPYSVRRGEIAAITIVIHNYFDQELTNEITLDNVDRTFEFAEVSNEILEDGRFDGSVAASKTKKLIVPKNGIGSISFMIMPKQLGHIPVKVTARNPLAGDSIQQKLLVLPEGIATTRNEVFFVDLRNTSTFTANVTLDIPKNRIPNSEFVEISAVGDLLGPMITNLDELIELPHGCGEQNMLNLVPNILVLNYLKNTNQLTPAVEGKALKFMEIGYQQELTYRRHDGSFSAFGQTDESGSVWLTAFVAKSLKQASPFITVEEDIITDALRWISDKQAINGSFPEVGRVSHQEMQGGARGSLALTAYVVISFLEQSPEVQEKYRNSINRAIDYIVRNMARLEDDVYSASICVYALHLKESLKEGGVLRDARNLLSSFSNTSNGMRWWQLPESQMDAKNPWLKTPNAINIEMTSYAMLALIKAGLVAETLPIVRWLVTQRNRNGGFQSTQDTVIGLQALAELGRIISQGNAQTNIRVNYEYRKDTTGSITINSENLLILQKNELPSNTKTVTIEATGTGFAVVQVSYKYNVNVTSPWPMFKLDPQVDHNSNSNHLQLSVCSSYVGTNNNTYVDESSNMVVMEVTLPSGYSVNPDSLPSLLAQPHVKRVETEEAGTKVILYFDHMHKRQEYCPTISAYRVHKVARHAPVPVRVYDYYNNARQARVFYEPKPSTLCDICEKEDCENICTSNPANQIGVNQTVAEVKDGACALGYSLVLSSIALLLLRFV